MKRYDNIQILRVLACLGVFVTHLAPRMGLTGGLARAANQGASGVYLFFLISGFLAFGEMGWTGSVWGVLTYYAKRLLRILPLYYAVIVYNMALHGLLLGDVTPDPAGLGWLRYAFLTNAFLPAPDNFWGNLTATWTVSMFLYFYVCAPLFVWFCERADGSGRGTHGGCLRAALLYVLSLALRFGWEWAGLSRYMMLFHYLHFFLLGMLVFQLAQLYRKGQRAQRAMPLLWLAVLAGGAFVSLWVAGTEPDPFLLWSWGFAATVLVTIDFSWGRLQGGRLHRAVALLDRMSYPIYLVHAVVIDGIGLLQAHIALPPVAVLLLAVALTAVGVAVADRLIEKPAQKWSARLVARLRM